MKILILTYDLNIKAGIGRYSFNIIQELQKQGIECDVLVSNITQKLPSINQQKFFKDFFKQSYNPLDIIKDTLRLRKKIKNNNYELIHAFDGYPYSILGYLATYGLKNKFFISGIGTYTVQPLQSFIKGWLLKKAYLKAHKIFCISNFVKKRILHYIPQLKNLIVVNLGSDFKIHPEVIRSFIHSQPTIISIGALKKRKGQHLTIQALKIIKEKIPNIQLRLIGSCDSPKHLEYLKKLVHQNNLTNHVHFISNLTDTELESEYKKADLFCMPSVSVNDNIEGFGIVYLEAASYGLPCIGSLNTGAEDAISDKYNGFLVKHNNVQDLSAKILQILTNQKLYSAMSANSLIWVEKFSWSKTVKSYIQGYLS